MKSDHPSSFPEENPNKTSSENREETVFEDIFSNAPKEELPTPSPKKQNPYHALFSHYEDISSNAPQDEKGSEADDFFSSDFFTEVPEDLKAAFEADTPPSEKPKPLPYHYHYTETEKPDTAAQSSKLQGTEPQRKKKKHKGLKITLSVIAVLLVLLLLLGSLGVQSLKKLLSFMQTQPLPQNPYIAETDLLSLPDCQNILLIGTDARSHEEAQKTRSDTMILITIDRKNNQIKLTSFLRDLYVDIPDYRADKINAAHSHGGSALLVHTIEYNFKIKIDAYATVTFEVFTTLVDALGGVDVEITQKEAKYINSQNHMAPEDIAAFPEKLSGGMQHFTGQQALWYSRIRYLDSDFNRTARQRKVMLAIAKKAETQSPSTLLAIAKSILPLVTTSLSPSEVLQYVKLAPSLLKYSVAEQQIPAKNAYKSQSIRGMSCLVPDMEKNQTILQHFLTEKVEEDALLKP